MISGHGLTGEWADLPAHGLNMDAFAGAVPIEQEGVRPMSTESYRTVGTTLAGIEAALGICAALYRRAAGGGGQFVNVSIWESALAWMWRDLTTYANTGGLWTAYRDMGARYDICATADGLPLLVCPIEQQFCLQLAIPPVEVTASMPMARPPTMDCPMEASNPTRVIWQEKVRNRRRFTVCVLGRAPKTCHR